MEVSGLNTATAEAGVFVMKLLLPVLIALVFVSGTVANQTPQAREQSPRDVAEQYQRMIADGSLLTSEGWSKANEIFLHPSPPPRDKVVMVTSKRGQLDERWIKNNQAEVDEWGIYNLGRIDSKLRYEPSPKTKSDWTVYVYHLVLTDKHGDHGAEGQPAMEVAGPREWKLDGSQSVRWATVDAAIRYVTTMRDKSTDAIVKKNAERTLSTLKRSLR